MNNSTLEIDIRNKLTKIKIIFVIPVYKSKNLLRKVIESIEDYVDYVILIDDACPFDSISYVQDLIDSNEKIIVHRNIVNLGVGGSVKIGYQLALNNGGDIIVKCDSDFQMHPADAILLINKIIHGYGYAKGNRFSSISDVKNMPKLRIAGNFILGLINALSSGYYSIKDPTNGYTAISRSALLKLNINCISNRFFFESDMLYNLNLHRITVIDVPMPAKYGNEQSNLNAFLVIPEFSGKLLINYIYRIYYLYYIKGFTVEGAALFLSLILITIGGSYTSYYWINSSFLGNLATAGQIAIGGGILLIGLQLLLIFLVMDIRNEPKPHSN